MGTGQSQPYPDAETYANEQYHDAETYANEQYHDAETYANEFSPLNKLHQPELMMNVSDFLSGEIPATTRKNDVLSTCTPDPKTFRTTPSTLKHGGRVCPEFTQLSHDDACCVFSTKDRGSNKSQTAFLRIICHAMRKTTTTNPLRLSRFVDWVRRDVCPQQPTISGQLFETTQANDKYFSEIKFILETFQPTKTHIGVRIPSGPIQKLPLIGFFRSDLGGYFPSARSLVDVSDMPRQISAYAKRVKMFEVAARQVEGMYGETIYDAKITLWDKTVSDPSTYIPKADEDTPCYFLPQSTNIEQFLSDLTGAMQTYAEEASNHIGQNFNFSVDIRHLPNIEGTGTTPAGYTPLYLKQDNGPSLLTSLSHHLHRWRLFEDLEVRYRRPSQLYPTMWVDSRIETHSNIISVSVFVFTPMSL